MPWQVDFNTIGLRTYTWSFICFEAYQEVAEDRISWIGCFILSRSFGIELKPSVGNWFIYMFGIGKRFQNRTVYKEWCVDWSLLTGHGAGQRLRVFSCIATRERGWLDTGATDTKKRQPLLRHCVSAPVICVFPLFLKEEAWAHQAGSRQANNNTL